MHVESHFTKPHFSDEIIHFVRYFDRFHSVLRSFVKNLFSGTFYGPPCWGGWDCRFEQRLLRAPCRWVHPLTTPRPAIRGGPFAPRKAMLFVGLRPTGAHPLARFTAS